MAADLDGPVRRRAEVVEDWAIDLPSDAHSRNQRRRGHRRWWPRRWRLYVLGRTERSSHLRYTERRSNRSTSGDVRRLHPLGHSGRDGPGDAVIRIHELLSRPPE